MAYDEELADRIRDLVAGEERVSEQRMFGGLAFLVNGNMAVAASGEGGLLVRVDPAAADEWIDGDGVAPMVMRGREMKGWLRVRTGLDAEGIDAEGLEVWVSRGVTHARSLPPKRP
jgi:TfoX/Sxy family transcriptional regulator of competence genes